MTGYPVTSALIPITDIGKVNDLWCVFEHHQPPHILYVNACKLTDVFRLKDARENSEWFRMFHAGGPLSINIIYITSDRNEAIKVAIERTKAIEPMPRCNLHGYNMNKAARPIICSNGQTYRNQSEAAIALNVGQSNISRHLRGELRAVNGYTFAYSPTPEPGQ